MARRTVMLSAEQEILLARRIRDEDEDDSAAALAELVTAHIPMAIRAALWFLGKKSRGVAFDRDDLFGCAQLGLVEAANVYDPDGHGGYRFATIAGYYIMKNLRDYGFSRSLIRIPRHYRDARRRKFKPPTDRSLTNHEKRLMGLYARHDRALHAMGQIDADLTETSVSGSGAGDHEAAHHATTLIGQLDEEDRYLIEHQFGVNGKEKLELRAVAKVLGVSKQTICTRRRKAFARLAVLMEASA